MRRIYRPKSSLRIRDTGHERCTFRPTAGYPPSAALFERRSHLRRLLNLVRLYGRQEVIAALARANEYRTYDAAYVETILLQERRRRELPSPTLVRPRRAELIEETDLEEPDPAVYDRWCETDPETTP